MNRAISKIMTAVLALAVLCIGVGASVAAEKQKQEQVEQHTYVSKTIIDVPWGDAPHEFGLSKGPETFGVRTFTLDRKGNIYIYDHVKRYIKKYDKDGNFEGNIGPVTLGSSIAVGVNGHIFVIRGHAVDEYLKNGKLLKTHQISGGIGLTPGYGQGIKFDEAGNLLVNDGYTLYQIGRTANGKFEALSHKKQKESKRRGDPSNRKDRRIKTKVKSDNLAMLQILDDEGNILKEKPMHAPESFGGVQIIGQDGDGFIYVQAGILLKSDARIEVRKYSEEGNLFKTINLQMGYYTEPNKITEVDGEGNVYQLLPAKEGVKIIKWEQIDEGDAKK
jgi:hypothetical protein